MSAAQVHLDVHGVRAAVASADPGFAAFVTRNYRLFETPADGREPGPPDLAVRLGYTATRRAAHGDLAAEDVSRLGLAPLLGREGLLRSFRGGSWLLRRGASPELELEIAVFRPAGLLPRLGWSLAVRQARPVGYRYLLRQAVNPALLWLLRRRSGILRTHAAAVEKDGRALILAGPAGAGKSTLALHLWKERGYRLLCDNSCLFDRREVYGFPESSRVFPGTLRLLGLPPPSDAGRIEGRYQVALAPSDLARRARPAALVWLETRPAAARAPLPTAEAVERLFLLHAFLEWETYLTFGALYPGAAGESGTARETLAALLCDVPCWTLALPRPGSLAKAASLLDGLF